MDILNNREISIIIWLSVFVFFVSFKKDIRIRESISGVFKTLLHKQILIPIGLMVLYVAALVYSLSEFELWNIDQLKNTIVWFFSVAFVSMLGISNISEKPHYFKTTFQNNLKIIVVIQFVLTFYTFSLIGELFFVPFIALISLLLAVASHKEEHKNVENLLNWIFMMIGIGIIIYTIYKLLTDYGEFFQEKTFYDLVIPTTLSILFLPFLYFLSLYVNYQNIWLRLPIFLKDNEVIKYARYKSLLSFNFKTSLLRRWFDVVVRIRPETKEEVDNSILEIKSILKREENPVEVPESKGWSPYKAMSFLKDEGLKTGHYKELYNNEWFASSSMLDVGGSVINNVAYYIDGSRDIATVLKIKLNLNNPDKEEKALGYLALLADTLCQKAIDAELSSELESAIFEKESEHLIINSKKCSIEKEDNLNNKGYSLKFTIEVT